jgi:hypothetical protein
MLHLFLLHGSLGLLDEGLFVFAIVMMAAALLCFAGYMLQERKQPES